MLNEVMIYTRTDTPDFSTRLTREELRVFTAVQGETGVAAIVTKTRLDFDVVQDAIAKLIARKLIRSADGHVPRPPDPVAPAQTAVAWLAQRQAAEAFLASRLGGDKALPYVAQLHDCTSEGAFAGTVRALAKRLSLIVDTSVGDDLLSFLEREG